MSRLQPMVTALAVVCALMTNQNGNPTKLLVVLTRLAVQQPAMLGIRPEVPKHLRNRVVEVSAPNWRLTPRFVRCNRLRPPSSLEFGEGFLRVCPTAL
jgi:hypothetical protein